MADDWPRNDLRDFIEKLESTDWCRLSEDVLDTSSYLWGRYTGKGEVLHGYVSRKIISLDEFQDFQNALTFISKELRMQIKVE